MNQPKKTPEKLDLNFSKLEKFLNRAQAQSPLRTKEKKFERDLLLLFARIESILLREASVKDCKLLLKETKSGDRELIAYVVSANSFAPEQLQSCLREYIPESLLPKAYVPVNNLPLTDTGEIDIQKLMSLEIIDSELVREWEEKLESTAQIDRAAVIIREDTDKLSNLHLADLLPNWQKDRNRSSQPTKQVLKSVNSEFTQEKKPAICHGESLQLSADAPQNLAEVLLKAAKQDEVKGIIYVGNDGSQISQSYSQLLETASKILASLQNLGLKPQDKVILQLERNQDFIEAFWACILGGFVPVPISTASNYEPSNNSAKKLQNAWQMLEKPIVLTSSNLASQIDNFFSGLHLQKFTVASIEDLRFCQNDGDRNWYRAESEDLALLLLTSGSTGMPKAVRLSHSNIISSIVGSSEIGNFTSQDISLNWLPLDHPGPLIRCVIRMVYLGGQQIHAPTATVLQDPLKWLDWIDRYKVTSTWSPNFAFALLNNCAQEIEKRHWDLSSLKSWLNTAEPIVPQTAQKVLELLKPYGLNDKVMHSSWGMAETASGITHSQSYLEKSTEAFAELGKPISGISLRIVDQSDRIVSEKTIGYLQVKGSTVTSGYDRNIEINREAFSEDGWFKTGDLGYLEEGRLVITGRSKDVIIINGNNCYSHEIEAVVEEIEGIEISYTAACGIRKTGANTDSVAIFFHTSIQDDDRLKELFKQIQKNVAGKIGVVPSYLIPVEKQAIPKTSIGKIQRSQLVERFTAGEFEEIVKKIDILLGNDRTLPDWFYRLQWRAKEAVTLESSLKEGLTLVFLDSLGLGEYLCEEFNKSDCATAQPSDRATVAVEIGENFTQLARDRYCIDPKNPQHYQRLLESVSKNNQSIEQILHLWTYDNYNGEIESLEALEEAQVKGVYSLLLLVRALEKVRENQTQVKLQVIASHSQATNESEDIAYERSPLIGMLKTIPQEMTWLDCRHLDLPQEAPQINADRVLRELKVIQKEEEVAYRQGKRLISRLEKVKLRPSDRRSPLKPGGMYLISGGLGGIGVEIAKYLLEKYQARLLLVGKTPLPPRENWSAHIEEGGKLGDRIQAYLSLEGLNVGEIAYAAFALSDLEGLQQLVSQYSQQWNCQLDGIIHLAGTIQTSPILEETPQNATATFAPKLEGTWVLYQLIKNQPNSLFVSFSSVNGFFGRMTAGSYSAANRFLDSFTQHLVSSSSVQAYCFAWSMWEETGLSRNYQMKELNRSRGYHIIQPQQGLNSFLVGLQQNEGYLLVGLDESKQYIKQYTETEIAQTQQLCAYFTATDANCFDRARVIEVSDRFGTSSNCKLQQIEQMPLTETGAIDLQKLIEGESSLERVEPRNEIERQLVSIWQEVLGVKAIGVNDNFLELGGDSIKAAILINRLQEKIGTNIEFVTLFQAPTVAELAALLQKQPEILANLNNDRNPQKQIDAIATQARSAIAPVSWGNANRLLERIKNLGDREIDSLLDRLLSEQKQKRHLVAQLLQEKATQPNVFNLSFSQQRMWLLHQLEPDSAAYNMGKAIRFQGTLDRQILENSLKEIVARHEILRTTFEERDGQPVQIISREIDLQIPVVNLQQLPTQQQEVEIQKLIDEAIAQPFDLEKGLLIRAKLLELSAREHLLILTVHHIVADGWSQGIMVRELSEIYRAFAANAPSPLPELPIQYADFAEWQQQQIAGELLETQLSYWQEHLTGAPPYLDLPTDRPRPELASSRGAISKVALPTELVANLNSFSRTQGVTLFATMLAALKIVMSEWTKADDIVIGTVLAGRNRPETQNLIGCFINFLALRLRSTTERRSQICGDRSGSEFLQQVGKTVLEAYANQDCPFEKIVEAINPDRQTGNPIYNVALLLQNFPSESFSCDDLSATATSIEDRDSALLDLRFIVTEEAEQTVLNCEYNTDIFEATTIEHLIASYQTVLEKLVAQPETKLADFSIAPELERQAKQARAREYKQKIAIAATFTCEPIEESLDFWFKELELPSKIEFAPYNQVFQQLLDPNSGLSANKEGINIILVNFEDWLRYEDDAAREVNTIEAIRAKIEPNVRDLINILKAAAQRSSIPHLVGICPASPQFLSDWAAFATEMEQLLSDELAKISGIYLVSSTELTTTYPVEDYYDAQSNEIGHIPYTPTYFCALGTTIARKLFAIKSAPYKVIVLDCDNTLWKGVCGEVGAEGIVINPALAKFQQMLIQQQEAGILLCLCSKNVEEDVMKVFQQRSDMSLNLDRLVSWRINWQTKSENLKSLAKELNLGLDSFIFIDDNPVECAEVRANCPQVLTLQIPHQEDAIEQFIAHTWAFDRLKVTSEDKKRTELYQQNVQREKLRQDALTFNDFLAGLQLQIDINQVTPQQLARVAQLTQRTNQFNATTIRRTESEIQQLCQSGQLEARAIEVKDRFGDYGLVGFVLYKQETDAIVVDTLLLSCRVLGRGVEHQMLATLGKIASDRSLSLVNVPYLPTAKNQPAHDFLDSVGAQFKQQQQANLLFQFPAQYLAQLSYNPQKTADESTTDKPTKTDNSNIPVPIKSKAELFDRIVTELSNLDRVLQLINSQTRREVTANEHSFIAPRTETEEQLAQIWSEILNVNNVGVRDNFFELGGSSFLAVRLFTKIEKVFQQKLPLATLFQAPTIEQLATHLQQEEVQTSWSSLIPIQPNGSKPPLFLLHARGTSLLVYRDLAKNLGDDRPVYGIQPQGLAGETEILTDVEEMATYYIQQIRKIQPEGPYFLGGYSFGGQLAYEMAQQLHQQGQEVRKLVFFDCRGPNCYRRLPLSQRLKMHFDNILQKKHEYVIEKVLDWKRWLSDEFKFKVQKMGVWLFKTTGLSLPLSLQNIYIEERNLQASKNYQPKPYPGKITLLRANEWLGGVGYEIDEQLGWGSLAGAGVEIYDVPGDHFSLLEKPFVKTVAKQLKVALKRL